LAAKELRFKYVNREILQRAAKHLGTNTRALEDLDERSMVLVKSIIRGFSFGLPDAAYAPPMIRPIYDKDLFMLECKIMNQIVDEHSAVIVGRSGFHALRDRPGVIRIFIHAPKEFRVNRIMMVRNIKDMREARDEAEESDRRRAKFIQDMVGIHWTDARNYHLCIDSSAVDFHMSVEMIIRMVAKQKAI
ncbi:MAG TPA: cytidylate kinase-like family protein, partial [Syntrophales bacterium]|nr:cytidylate kinase-like family protein [Syntrophales bacterium]